MFTAQVIIVVCLLLIVAYVFDLTSHKTKIPSVILLMALGYAVKELAYLFNIHIPDLNPILPFLGTIGLILIVLEGSLEIELTHNALPIIKKSMWMAFVPMFIVAFGIGSAFHYFTGADFMKSLINAVPFCIISSAIAIPSVNNWSKRDKSFVIYESSLSDILGVILFNFIALNTTFTAQTYIQFVLEILLILVISFVATIALSFVLSRLQHRIKFGPILIFVVLIYEISKYYHLPALVFIMIFGLVIGNINKIKENKYLAYFKPEKLKTEVNTFKEIVVEATFLIRTLFFLLFGFLIELNEVFNYHTIFWSTSIVLGILLVRVIVLSFLKLSIGKFMFIAPRGLITILLFLSIDPSNRIPLVNNSMVIQVILISVLLMMLGVMFTKSNQED